MAEMKDVFLVMVNPDHNNNKYYEMKDNKDGTWTAVYGRIGQDDGIYGRRSTTYPSYMWQTKYNEKIAKGYQDMSRFHAGEKKNGDEAKYAPVACTAVQNLMDRLQRWARKCIEDNYTVRADAVTPEMIEKGRQEIRALSHENSVGGFNRQLMTLFHVIPRRMGNVADFLARKATDFDGVIQRENDLLSVMESQSRTYRAPENAKAAKDGATILEALGIEVFVATPKQEEEVKRHLSDSLKPKVKNVYRVVNKRTQEKMDAYLKANGKPKVKMFWHGSRNENWLSIMEAGLKLRPNAKVTGKMFGEGIYFAPSAMKSWGYTSSPSGRWNSERANTAVMGLYATAFGTPADVYSYGSYSSVYGEKEFRAEHPGKNCLYAHGGTGMLLNDEIVFYREDQMTINYLVEFAA